MRRWNWQLMIVLILLAYTWYNIIKFVPTIITCIPAMLALGLGALLVIVGVISSLRKS